MSTGETVRKWRRRRQADGVQSKRAKVEGNRLEFEGYGLIVSKLRGLSRKEERVLTLAETPGQ